MRPLVILILILIYSFLFTTSNVGKNFIKSKNDISLLSKPDTIFYLNKDTLKVYFSRNKNEIKIKVLKNIHELFDKTLTIDDIIGDTKYKAEAYFNELYLTDFNKENQKLIFTTYIKRIKNKKFVLDATFSLDLQGNLDVSRE